MGMIVRNIFVYGSLKSDLWNNHYLSEAKFIDKTNTTFQYDLLANGIPYLIPGLYSVAGEVWECPPKVVEELDRLEGHPEWYYRLPVVLEPEFLEAEAYLFVGRSATWDSPPYHVFNEEGYIEWRGK